MIDLQSLPTSSGIYYLQNINNNKIYIGKSVNIRKRVSRHNGELSKNKHCNPHLQYAWNIDGRDNFIAGVLELCDKELLSLKEIEYIQSYNASSMLYGYNLTDGGEGALGREVSTETREKIRSKQPDFHRGNSPRARSIVLLNSGEIFDCIKDAAFKFNVPYARISTCCSKKAKSAGKYNNVRLVWAYLEDYHSMSSSDIEHAVQEGQCAKSRGNNGRARPVRLINTNEIFSCVADAAEKYNISTGGILNNCKHITSYSGKHLGDKLRWEFYHKEVVV